MRQGQYLVGGRIASLAALCLLGLVAEAETGAAHKVSVELAIEETQAELVGGAIVDSLDFHDAVTGALHPDIRAREGDVVKIVLINHTRQTRAFAIMGVDGTRSAPVKAGATGGVTFKAPARGSYVYYDPMQERDGKARMPGLFGDFSVAPASKQKTG